MDNPSDSNNIHELQSPLQNFPYGGGFTAFGIPPGQSGDPINSQATFPTVGNPQGANQNLGNPFLASSIQLQPINPFLNQWLQNNPFAFQQGQSPAPDVQNPEHIGLLLQQLSKEIMNTTQNILQQNNPQNIDTQNISGNPFAVPGGTPILPTTGTPTLPTPGIVGSTPGYVDPTPGITIQNPGISIPNSGSPVIPLQNQVPGGVPLFSQQLELTKFLFHGTKSTPPSTIYNGEKGFMMQFAAEGMWGRGTYFAEKAKYSDDYCHTCTEGKQMFLAEVIVGDFHFCKSDRTLRLPPERKNKQSNLGFASERYDSVSGETNGSQIWIIYDNNKAYPTYLITYK